MMFEVIIILIVDTGVALRGRRPLRSRKEQTLKFEVGIKSRLMTWCS